MTHITCRLTAKNRDQLRTLRSVIENGLPLPFFTSVGGSRQHGYDVYDVFVHVFVRTPVSW